MKLTPQVPSSSIRQVHAATMLPNDFWPNGIRPFVVWRLVVASFILTTEATLKTLPAAIIEKHFRNKARPCPINLFSVVLFTLLK
jgi:hypothetical protein